LGAAVAFYLIYKKTGKIPFVPKKRIPPYVLAKRRLEELRKKRLAENGNLKAYYTDLTDILRQYLGGRFKIYALEMTSSQIIEAVEKNEETRPFADSFRALFKVADFVKFAKQMATTDDNIRSFKTVSEFVEATRPVEEETPQNTKKGASKKTKN
ncbi:MAG: cell wall anchor protein, partial [Muribaculaceae bacterium]|nr:cell wall anchor protein [Muribaculaceae bacterium]